MAELNLDKEKKDFEKVKGKFKKRFPIWYILLFLLWTVGVFYLGNFLEDSYFVKSTNPFNKLFGQTLIEITEQYPPEVGDNETIITFEATNIGDKDVNELYVLYSFCGLEQQKADLKKLKLRVGESEEFEIVVPIALNLSCSFFTDRVKADIYEDDVRNCYLDIEDKVSNVCKYCRVTFDVYADHKSIVTNQIWYPYLDEPTNAGALARYVLTLYPMTISWKDGHKAGCKVLTPNSSKKGLHLREPIYTGLFDTHTMCLRGDDIEWCKKNYYAKS